MIRKWQLIGLLVAGIVSAGEKKSLDLHSAARKVQEKVDGRVLGGKTVTENNKMVHVIRVLTPEGRVVHIRVDKDSGKILK